MESASLLPRPARFVAKPNGIVIDIYNNDRVQYQPTMVSPTVIVSKKKSERKLCACWIVTIIFILLSALTYNMMRSSKVTYDKIQKMDNNLPIPSTFSTYKIQKMDNKLPTPSTFSTTFLKNGRCDGITGPKSTFLWTINAPHLTSTSYLFGTIHMPNLWDNVSSQAKNAFNNSDALALEIDLRDPEVVKKTNTCFKFSNGTAIELFPNKTNIRQRIKRMTGFFQMNVGEFNKTDGFNNLTNLTNEDPVLDEILNLMAKAEGKPVISVETADEGCERLKFILEIEVASILLTEKLKNIIEDYEKNQYLYPRLFKEWRSKRSINDNMSQEEDEKDDLLVKIYACNILNKKIFIIMEDKIRQMNAQIIEIQSWRTRNWYELRTVNQIVEIYRAKIKLYEMLIEVMLTKRNVIMGKRIDEMLRKNPNTKYFIAFGVGHFIGKDSVQDHLITYGYTIKEVPFTDHF